jgi:hypothetical protein
MAAARADYLAIPWVAQTADLRAAMTAASKVVTRVGRWAAAKVKPTAELTVACWAALTEHAMAVQSVGSWAVCWVASLVVCWVVLMAVLKAVC